MKISRNFLWILPAIIIFLMIAGCKGGTFETPAGTGAGTAGAPAEPPAEQAAQATSVTALKMVQLDNGEVDLLGAGPFTPFPIRPQYFEATFSKEIDCDAVKANFMLMEGDTQVADVEVTCPEATKLRLMPTKNLTYKTDYKIKLSTWENFEGKEVPFHTMTKGDVNGDGVPDIAIGAPGVEAGAGAIHLYSGASGFPVIRSFQTTYSSAAFGTSISIQNDIDGDGYADIVVGAPGYNSNSGAVIIYSGTQFSASEPSLTPKVIAPGDSRAEFGQSFAIADMNGDGWSDIIIGAPGYNSDSGAVYVYDGRSFGLIQSVIRRDALNTRFGYSVAITDINRDGTPEIIIGMPSKPGVASYLSVINGKPFIERGAQEVLCDLGGGIGTQFGYSLAAAGDINGDEIPDIIIGEPGANSGLGHVGILDGRYILDGSVPALMTSAVIMPADHCTIPPTRFGESVAGGSDLNGNGVPEVIFGAPACNSNKGAIFIYELNAARTAFLPLRYLPMSTGAAGDVRFGSAISLMGDINADEVEELIIGAPLRDDKGSVYVYSGKDLGLGGAPVRIGNRLDGPSAAAKFGSSVNGGQ